VARAHDGAGELNPNSQFGGYGAVLVLLFAGWAALTPQPMAWVYIALVMLFEFWLARRIKALDGDAPPTGEPPYDFTAEEAGFIHRYRFYFTYPNIAAQASSVLAATGLTALVLAPWLTFKHAWLPAVIVGLNLFAVARFTKLLAPLMALRIAASRGDREALRMLELHGPLWAKIHAVNKP
jgi:hypothetical protein